MVQPKKKCYLCLSCVSGLLYVTGQQRWGLSLGHLVQPHSFLLPKSVDFCHCILDISLSVFWRHFKLSNVSQTGGLYFSPGKKKSQMNTPACGSFPLPLPLSCHSVTSSANFFLSFFLFFWLNPLPVCPSFYSFLSIPPHCILLFIIFLLNLKMASSYRGSPFWVFLGMAYHLSVHTPSGDALRCTLSMDAFSRGLSPLRLVDACP